MLCRDDNLGFFTTTKIPPHLNDPVEIDCDGIGVSSGLDLCGGSLNQTTGMDASIDSIGRFNK